MWTSVSAEHTPVNMAVPTPSGTISVTAIKDMNSMCKLCVWFKSAIAGGTVHRKFIFNGFTWFCKPCGWCRSWYWVYTCDISWLNHTEHWTLSCRVCEWLYCEMETVTIMCWRKCSRSPVSPRTSKHMLQFHCMVSVMAAPVARSMSAQTTAQGASTHVVTQMAASCASAILATNSTQTAKLVMVNMLYLCLMKLHKPGREHCLFD